MKTKKCSSCQPTNKNIASAQKSVKYSDLMKQITKNISPPDLSKPKLFKPKNANKTFDLDLGPKFKSRFVFYFAAKPNKMSKCDVIQTDKVSYGYLKNSGLVKTDSSGKCRLEFVCPQAYKDVLDTYLPHVHFLISTKDNKKFNQLIKTHSVHCDVTKKELKQIIKSDCALVINALPYEYYVKSRIPMSISLPYTLLKEKKLDKKDVDDYIKTMLVHSKKISKAVKDKKLKLHDIPIVIYCWNASCEADTICMEHLHKFGYKNIRLYPDGITGWNKN